MAVELGVERRVEGLVPNLVQAMGTGTLAAGTATITNRFVTARSIILATRTAAGAGVLRVVNRVAGTSFDVVSSDALDAGTFDWLQFEPVR